MATTYLVNSNPTAGNRTKGTISVWFKRSNLSGTQWIYTERNGSNNYAGIRFSSDAKLGVFSYDSGSAQMDIELLRKFRDTNAWYHAVVSWDTTDGTASDRVKIYINGVRETVFDGSPVYPSSSQNINFGRGSSSYPINIGRPNDTAEYFDGSMSHFHRVDNQALAQTVFGEYDDNGVWTIKTSPSITYTGSSSFNFFILKDTNSGTDQSGQSNNLTVGGGTLTKTEDCPSNVFATFNPLAKHGITTSTPSDFMANGNTTFYTPSDNNARKGLFLTSLGATSGKYYCEYKQGGGGRLITGICNANIFKATNEPYVNSNQSALLYLEINSEIKYDGSNYSTGIQGGADGDIFGFALDLDNKHWYIHKNGTYFNSGDPTSGATGTGSIIAATSTSAFFNHGEMFFCAGDFEDSDYATSNWNFGNGYFGTTAVSSAGTNASGIGIFEYDVPTGYTALSTKGLNL